MYDMDMRDYDPAIARWVVQDPIIHYNTSLYSAMENNPILWADPSGASVEGHNDSTDWHGRDKFDQFNIYIAPNDRVDVQDFGSIDGYGYGSIGDPERPRDKSTASALKTTAKLYFDDEDVSSLSESDKQKIFKTDVQKRLEFYCGSLLQELD